jgi:flagellar FliL protein
MSQTDTAAAPTEPAPKGRSKLLKFGVPLLVLLIAGGGGWWYFYGRSSATVEAAAPPPPEPGIVEFEPFIVNLADPGGRRFLRVVIHLLVPEKEAAELDENKLLHSRVRSAILELLTTQTSASVSTPEGRAALKKAIAETAAHAIEHLEVSDVLFAEFVVQ